jgi:hypothetical protein
MKARAQTLCPECEHCPEVRIEHDGTVRIGEDDNVVTLQPGAWNELVRLVRSGALAEVVRD